MGLWQWIGLPGNTLTQNHGFSEELWAGSGSNFLLNESMHGPRSYPLLWTKKL